MIQKVNNTTVSAYSYRNRQVHQAPSFKMKTVNIKSAKSDTIPFVDACHVFISDAIAKGVEIRKVKSAADLKGNTCSIEFEDVQAPRLIEMVSDFAKKSGFEVEPKPTEFI